MSFKKMSIGLFTPTPENKVEKSSINRVLDLITNEKEYFCNQKDFQIGFNRANQFRLPGFESRGVELLRKVLPISMSKIDLDYNKPTAESVKVEDLSNIEVMCKPHDIEIRSISRSILSKVLNDIVNKLGMDNYTHKNSLEFEDLISILPKNTSSGYPFYGKKSDPKVIEYTEVIYNNFFKSLITDLSLWKFPITIFHRFSTSMIETGNDLKRFNKIRLIQGVPFIILLLEVKFCKNFKELFLDKFKNIVTIGYTRPKVSEKIKLIRDTSFRSGRKVFCGDLSKCDISIPRQLIAFMYGLISAKMDDNEFNFFRPLVYFICNTPIMCNDRKIRVTKGSNPTGIWLTSLLNTVSLIVVLNYFNYVTYGKALKEGEYLVQGDDFLIILDDGDQKKLKTIFELFNFRLNLHKSLMSDYEKTISFLGFEWNSSNEPDNPDNWLIAKILFPERFVDMVGPDRIIARYLSLIFQLRRSKSLFNKFLAADPFLKEKFSDNINFELNLVTSDGRFVETKVPIGKFLNVGWRLF